MWNPSAARLWEGLPVEQQLLVTYCLRYTYRWRRGEYIG